MEWYFYVKICHVIYLYRVVLKLSCYSKELNFSKKVLSSFMSSSTLLFWSNQILLTCKKSKRYFKAKINIIFHIRGFSFVPPMSVREHKNFLHHRRPSISKPAYCSHATCNLFMSTCNIIMSKCYLCVHATYLCKISYLCVTCIYVFLCIVPMMQF